jgi:mRNA-degrading endonuclease toxin of MazEF toxin-antitoxin module
MARQIVKRGSVVLVRYPLTDLTGVKVRPAVILTPNRLMSKLDDVLCLFISSSMPAELLATDFVLERK